jgi:hypothetical protein
MSGEARSLSELRMTATVIVTDSEGNVFEGETELAPRKRERGPGDKGARISVGIRATTDSAPPRTPTEGLRRLHQRGVFKTKREIKAVEEELAKSDCNFQKASLAKALERAGFLTRLGKRGSFCWIQKYPPQE